MATNEEPPPIPGYLEGRIAEQSAFLQELSRRIDSGLQAVNQGMDSGLQAVNRRIDRLFLAILGVGGAMLAALIVLIVRGL